MEKELTKLDFEKELKTMAINCIGVKEATAKEKASAIFKKYEELISFSKSDEEYYRSQYIRESRLCEALKSGCVKYERVEHNTRSSVEGVIPIRDIEQVEVWDGLVLLITKTGREIVLDSEFEFLRDIF